MPRSYLDCRDQPTESACYEGRNQLPDGDVPTDMTIDAHRQVGEGRFKAWFNADAPQGDASCWLVSQRLASLLDKRGKTTRARKRGALDPGNETGGFKASPDADQTPDDR